MGLAGKELQAGQDFEQRSEKLAQQAFHDG
jgi:hypothetical protein